MANEGCRPLTDGEVAVVKDSFGGHYAARDRALFVIGVRTGFRVSEILSIRLADVLDEQGRFADRLTVHRRCMKGKREGRSVPMHREIKDVLLPWIQELQAAGYITADSFVFQSRKGANKPISRVQAHRILAEAYATNELGGKVATHSMRKTFAHKVHHALKGDLVKTQVALGHRNINSTVRYLNVNQGEVDEAVLNC